MKNQNKVTKHVSVRLTWHDNGWNGESCKDPKNNLSCQQDANLFIHKTKIIKDNKCYTDTKKAQAYINSYLKQNSCFLKHSKLGYICTIHSAQLENENGIADIPPCDSFSAFKKESKKENKKEKPYVHTKNPARKIDEFDEKALKICKKKNQEPWDFVRNWNQVKYFPQDYRNHIINGSSIALFYTVNFPEESGKFIVGYSVIKDKNDDFIPHGYGKTKIFNKSNAGSRWGEEWCFILEEEDRYRFPFQELIGSRNIELLEQVKNILKVEPQDEKYFRNLSLFIPEHILIKYLKKLRQAVSLLELYGEDPKIGGDFSKIDAKIQQLTKTYLSFKYPGLPAVGRFLYWWSAFSNYEENLEFEDNLKKLLFETIKNHNYFFETNGKRFYIGSKKKNLHPKNDFPEDFIQLLEDIIVYYPISNEKVIERIKLLIDKNILSIYQIKQNPYILYEEFVPSLDGSINLSFEDIDYGEYKRSIETYRQSDQSEKSKNKIAKSFYLNPYRIRALIHEYFKVYRDDPGFIWVSFKDIESYIRKRLSSGLGTGDFDLDFEKILKSSEINETIEIDWNKRYLTLKKLAEIEKKVKEDINLLITQNNDDGVSSIVIRNIIKNVLGEVSENEIQEKENAIQKLLENKLTFVSGVAGAGKSTVIKIFTEVLNGLGEDFKILTPTGKASERLREWNNRNKSENIKTIHYFLKSNGFMDNELFIFKEDGEIQEVENLIIDEISMVPLDLLYYLLNAVNLGQIKRIIFVGDIKQLPPIGYGYPAKDIYNFLEQNHPQNLIKLEKSYRSCDKFIQLANKLRNDNLMPEDVKPYLTDNINDDNFQILKFSNQEELEVLINQIIQKEGITKEKLAQDPEIFQILTPKKEGYTGSNHLNRYINSLFNIDKFSWDNTKIIKLINTYCPPEKENCVETFNGMIGIVFLKKDNKNKSWKIRFKGGQIIPFYADKMGYEYDYAYTITIHKSQGSEFDTVVVILPENIGNLFTRELLYTALTRAKRKLYLLVENENLLYETPLEIERSSKLFGENLLELPESTGYVSLQNMKLLSKLDLYIASMLELKGIHYKYKTSGADFETADKKIHLINLNTYQGRIKNKTISEDETNIKIVFEKEINIKSFAEKLGIESQDRSSENKEDYREKKRTEIIEKEQTYIEPDTNFKIITHNGLITRSISESILMFLFDYLGWNYEYEKEVNLNGKKLLPDFYFPDKNIYWEHLGLLNDPYYLERWKVKRKVYEDAWIKVLSLKDWNGEKNCCIYTTEEDIKNLNKLWGILKNVSKILH
ncbi:AAA family ATPase [Persephonella sp. KM09-Lau-8]|uniref:ATP-dependent DNA helicase n=1 Tax=Persephonella sp. KM09-Lau-8 TaxID=1158345 RepID=UPI000496239D|nr:AAA family ATPase [Persephonella sp. KM09-Lau-8]